MINFKLKTINICFWRNL